jgi:hypothetical protein
LGQAASFISEIPNFIGMPGIGLLKKMTPTRGVPANRALKRANSGDRMCEAKAIDR